MSGEETEIQTPTINKISKNDERYTVLLTIPKKNLTYDLYGYYTFVYLFIHNGKDYCLVHRENEIILETLMYIGSEIKCIYLDKYRR